MSLVVLAIFNSIVSIALLFLAAVLFLFSDRPGHEWKSQLSSLGIGLLAVFGLVSGWFSSSSDMGRKLSLASSIINSLLLIGFVFLMFGNDLLLSWKKARLAQELAARQPILSVINHHMVDGSDNHLVTIHESVLSFSIENKMKASAFLYRADLPNSGGELVAKPISPYHGDGNQVSYVGHDSKIDPTSSDSYLEIASGQKKEFHIDLAKNFDPYLPNRAKWDLNIRYKDELKSDSPLKTLSKKLHLKKAQ